MDKKSIIVLLILPLQILLQKVFLSLGIIDQGISGLIFRLILSGLGVYLIFKLRGEMLRKDFEIFKENKLKNIFLSFLGGILSFLIIKFTNDFMRTGLGLLSVGEIDPIMENGWIMLLSSLVPTSAPFIEEPAFRYELYYNLRNRGIPNIVLALGSSILFGLVHLGNYSGNIYRTIPLMIVALLYSYLYKISKNIWTPIFAHMIYNGSLSILSSILIIILQ